MQATRRWNRVPSCLQRRRWATVLHRDAVAEARRLEPSIPVELDGVPVRHELVLAATP